MQDEIETGLKLDTSGAESLDQVISMYETILNEDISRDQLKWVALNRLYTIASAKGDVVKAAEYDSARLALQKQMAPPGRFA